MLRQENAMQRSAASFESVACSATRPAASSRPARAHISVARANAPSDIVLRPTRLMRARMPHALRLAARRSRAMVSANSRGHDTCAHRSSRRPVRVAQEGRGHTPGEKQRALHGRGLKGSGARGDRWRRESRRRQRQAAGMQCQAVGDAATSGSGNHRRWKQAEEPQPPAAGNVWAAARPFRDCVKK